MTERVLLLGQLVSRTDVAGGTDLVTALNAPGARVALTPGPPALPRNEWNHAHELDAAVDQALAAGAPADYRLGFGVAGHSDPGFPRGPYVLVAIELPDGRWLTARSSTSHMEWGWRHVAGIWSSLTLVLLVAGILWVARRTTRHLPRLALAAARLGIDVNTAPMEESGPREIKRAARAFNQMQARIRGHMEERTAMLAAVSHDLRTYLTRLELRTETIDDPAQQSRMRADIGAMNQMLEELLSFAREDGRKPDPVPLELRSLLESLVDEQRDLGRRADLAAGELLTLVADPIALKRALTNLLENAIRYGECARLNLQHDLHHGLHHELGDAVVTIDDDGPGISPADRETVLKPFERLDASRNRSTGGSGLGLAIARSIVAKHQGTLTLGDAPGGGLRVELRLPIQAAIQAPIQAPD